jgi:hypothetical protein
MADLDVRFIPSGRTLQRFHDSDARRRFLLGPLGSGKTFSCAFEGLRRCQEQAPDSAGVRRSAGLVTRTTMPELKTTALKDWLQLTEGKFGGALGRFYWGPPTVHELRFKLPDGTRVEADVNFMGLDDPDGIDKVRGMPLTWAWANEFREIPFPLLTMIYGRCGRFPRMDDGGPTWHGMFGDTNMPDVDHWIHRLAEQEQLDGWEFFKQPGGLVRDGAGWAPNRGAENLENLPPDYYMSQVAGNRPEWIAVYLAAEYGFVSEGQPVYPEFRTGAHVKDFAADPRLPLYVGLDFGLTPAASFAQQARNGQWRVHSELVTEDMGAARFAELLGLTLRQRYPSFKIAAITGDPSGDNRSQSDESTCFQMLRAARIHAKPAPTNDPTLRRDTVARALTRMIEGEPAMIIHSQCAVLRKGMAGAYCLRRKRISGEQFESVPRKNEYSHVCESLQYLMLGAGEHRILIRPERDAKQPAFAVSDYAMFEEWSQ